jgi:hypothetical protein
MPVDTIAAEARGRPLSTALVYVIDSARQTLSAPAMLRWAEKYGRTPAQEFLSRLISRLEYAVSRAPSLNHYRCRRLIIAAPK